MRNNILSALLLIAICFSACGSNGPGPECRSNSDCIPPEVCRYGWCMPSVSYLPSGAWTEECGCWNNYVFAGETRRNDYCLTGYDVVIYCDGWCHWGDYPWGRVCE